MSRLDSFGKHEHPAWQDRHGRLIVRSTLIGDLHFSADDSLEALDEAIRLNRDRATIEELMQCAVPPRAGHGPRARRRAWKPKPLPYRKCVEEDAELSPTRGRPLLGARKRIRVHLSIGIGTHEVLRARGISLAKALDACADQMVAHAG